MSDLLHTYTTIRSPKGQMTSYMIYFLYLILNFSPSALVVEVLFFCHHCSHSPYFFKWGDFSVKNSREFCLHLLLSYTLSSITLWTFYSLPVSSLFKASVSTSFLHYAAFFILWSPSLLVSQTQIKPSQKFSGSSHLASNDPLASLSCLRHSILIALSLLSTWEKLSLLPYPP